MPTDSVSATQGQCYPPGGLGAVTAIAAGSEHTILIAVPPPCDSDQNGDGVVNGADLAIVVAQWGTAGDPCVDLSGDGTIGGADIAILLASWG